MYERNYSCNYGNTTSKSLLKYYCRKFTSFEILLSNFQQCIRNEQSFNSHICLFLHFVDCYDRSSRYASFRSRYKILRQSIQATPFSMQKLQWMGPYVMYFILHGLSLFYYYRYCNFYYIHAMVINGLTYVLIIAYY